VIVAMLLVGICFSAFFSGTETGFYRVTRVRLALDALGGDRVARHLLWLINNPALFVATTLIGNNLANYVVSRATVEGARELFGAENHAAELLAPIVLAPVLFVYGELLPKNLFYLAPNRLLRRSGPPFILCGVIFAPISAVLWTLGRGLQSLVGEAPERVRLRLAREELQRVLEEGQEAGVLRPTQRRLVQGLFSVANEPVARFATPLARTTLVPRRASRTELVRVARRHRSAIVLVAEYDERRPIGYVSMVDVYLNQGDWRNSLRPLIQIRHTQPHIATLIRMQTEKEPVAQLVDHQGRSVGIVSIERLTERLLGG
jgi:CBS domain containing-hemolysin-like protein